MNIWGIYTGSLVFIIALCALIPLCKGIAYAARSRQERREREQKAAQEAAQAEQRKREQEQKAAQEAQRKAAEQEAKRRAAAEKKAEQKRKAEERAQAILEKRQEQQRRQEEKLEAARQLAEYHERALQAEKELQRIRQAQDQQPQEQPQEAQEKPAQQEAQPQEAQEAPQEAMNEPATPAALSLAQFAAAHTDAPQPFKGQAVSFTGTLYDAEGKHVPRAQAIQLVTSLGGKAYETMPAGTTLLVVGKRPGMGKLDKADEWIGQVRKITPAQFFAMAKG